jgi:hypothetical protein
MVIIVRYVTALLASLTWRPCVFAGEKIVAWIASKYALNASAPISTDHGMWHGVIGLVEVDINILMGKFEYE